MIDYNQSIYHKVKQSIQLLNLFTNTMSKSKDQASQLVKSIKEISNLETKEYYNKKYINNI